MTARSEQKALPSALYVWLVPSEEVLDQPGSWRIRKWDIEPFPEANFALSATPSFDIVREYEILTGDVACPLGHQAALREIQRRFMPSASSPGNGTTPTEDRADSSGDIEER